MKWKLMRSFTPIALSERTVEARLVLDPLDLWHSRGEHLIPISSLCVAVADKMCLSAGNDRVTEIYSLNLNLWKNSQHVGENHQKNGNF